MSSLPAAASNKIPSKRRGGRTSRWAMKKSKTYTTTHSTNYTQRHNKGQKDITNIAADDDKAIALETKKSLPGPNDNIDTMHHDYMVLMTDPAADDHDHHPHHLDDCRVDNLVNHDHDHQQQEEAGGLAMPAVLMSSTTTTTITEEEEEEEVVEVEKKETRDHDGLCPVNIDQCQKESHEMLLGPHPHNDENKDDDLDESGGIEFDGGLLGTFNELIDNVELLQKDPNSNGVLTLSDHQHDHAMGVTHEVDQVETTTTCGHLSSSSNEQVCFSSIMSMTATSSSSASAAAGSYYFDMEDGQAAAAANGNDRDHNNHILWDWESVVEAGHELWDHDDDKENMLSWLWEEGTCSSSTTSNTTAAAASTIDRHLNWEGDTTTDDTSMMRKAVDPDKQNAMVAWLLS
ncbi:hypothetical protein L3X38_045521 [Prunus dulcis]|uniref:Uncharacterized protein n=1 Tax=Prunus dulcis TaxID=3755 RepID=A0AAD4UPF8_PRUDU|nr:hypothetical protein L3X38_045521 [Prunus dulcis]